MIKGSKHPVVQPVLESMKSADSNYSKYCDVSATQLLGGIGYYMLQQQHPDHVINMLDYTDRWIGQVLHEHIRVAGESLESTDYAFERMFTTDVNGWSVGGKVDCIRHHDDVIIDIIDWKVTKSYRYNLKKYGLDYMRQLRIYDWLAEQNGYEVNKLWLVMLYKDYSKKRAEYARNYPPSSIVGVSIGKDPNIGEWIEKRVALMQICVNEGIVPTCDKSERMDDDLKCRHYCDMSIHCEYWQSQLLNQEKEIDDEIPEF